MQPNPIKQGFVTLDELANWLKVDPSRILAEVEFGTLPCMRIGGGLYFDQREVELILIERPTGDELGGGNAG